MIYRSLDSGYIPLSYAAMVWAAPHSAWRKPNCSDDWQPLPPKKSTFFWGSE